MLLEIIAEMEEPMIFAQSLGGHVSAPFQLVMFAMAGSVSHVQVSTNASGWHWRRLLHGKQG